MKARDGKLKEEPLRTIVKLTAQVRSGNESSAPPLGPLDTKFSVPVFCNGDDTARSLGLLLIFKFAAELIVGKIDKNVFWISTPACTFNSSDASSVEASAVSEDH